MHSNIPYLIDFCADPIVTSDTVQGLVSDGDPNENQFAILIPKSLEF